MAKRRKTVPEARHVRIYVSMMQTPAWRDLNPYARAAYVEMSSRYGGPDSNNGRIPYSGRDLAQNLNVSKPTALRAFKNLQDHGFIVLVKAGRYGRKRRYAPEWMLTEFGYQAEGQEREAPPTHAYRKWQGTPPRIAVEDFEDRLRALHHAVEAAE
jgi:AraC-like DNA-binding protein